MTLPHYDILVVGASFAGVACALAAARAGLRVAVLERKNDPGAKLHTTGILVKEVAEQTWLRHAPVRCVHRIEHVRLYSPKLRSLLLSAPGYYFLTTDTPELMRWLADELIRHGVELRLGALFTGAVECTQGWAVPGVGTTRYLIGADGARSKVARCAGLGHVTEYLFGLEYEFAGMILPEPTALHCFVSKRYARGYIGWLAQNPTGVQVGVAARYGRGRPDLEGFLAAIQPILGASGIPTPSATRAGLIPCGGPVAVMARNGAILTGDAGGIVSPVTAGGIHSAWKHGETIGQAIATHLAGTGPSPEDVASAQAPRFAAKRLLRWAYDHFQYDWPFDLLLNSKPLRWAAQRLYFHQRAAS